MLCSGASRARGEGEGARVQRRCPLPASHVARREREAASNLRFFAIAVHRAVLCREGATEAPESSAFARPTPATSVSHSLTHHPPPIHPLRAQNLSITLDACPCSSPSPNASGWRRRCPPSTRSLVGGPLETVARRPRTLHHDQLEAGIMQLTPSVGHGQWPQAVHAIHPLPGLPILSFQAPASRFDVAPMATGQASSPKFIPVCRHGTANVRLPNCFDHLHGLGPTLWTFSISSAWLSVCNPLPPTLHAVHLSTF